MPRLVSYPTALALALAAIGCSPDADAGLLPSPPATAPPLERAVVRDVPLTRTAPSASTVEPTARLSTALPATATPTSRPVDELLDPDLPAQLPRQVGQIVTLSPVRCGAVSVSSTREAVDCDVELLVSGATGAREFVSALTFDLSALPPADEVAHATLELTGAEDERTADFGRWYLRVVEPPRRLELPAVTFGQLQSLPDAHRDLIWRLRAKDIAAGKTNVITFDERARALLADRLGKGRLTLRIDGPINQENLFAWWAAGDEAPRLTIGYVTGRPTPTPDHAPPITGGGSG